MLSSLAALGVSEPVNARFSLRKGFDAALGLISDKWPTRAFPGLADWPSWTVADNIDRRVKEAAFRALPDLPPECRAERKATRNMHEDEKPSVEGERGRASLKSAPWPARL